MVTQVAIARALGLDVSSVNKILNRKAGPKFKAETRKRVFRAAREMGYKQSPGAKSRLAAAVRRLFPISETAEAGAARLALPVQQVAELRDLVAKAE